LFFKCLFLVFAEEVATESSMDLISKLIQWHHLAWCGLNKAVSLSLKRCHSGSVANAFQVCCANGFRFTSHLDDLHFRSSDCFHVSIHGISFSLLFSKLSTLLV